MKELKGKHTVLHLESLLGCDMSQATGNQFNLFFFYRHNSSFNLHLQAINRPDNGLR